MSKQRQGKKEQFTDSQSSKKSGKFLVLIAIAVIAGAVGAFVLTQGATDGYARVQSSGGEVRLDLSKIDDGQAHYFRYATQKGEVSFFVIKSVDGVMRAAFDACDVCYLEKKGYRQEGDTMVCNNCNTIFRSDLINLVKGGCNPAPLSRRIEAGQLVISDQDLLAGAWYFGS